MKNPFGPYSPHPARQQASLRVRCLAITLCLAALAAGCASKRVCAQATDDPSVETRASAGAPPNGTLTLGGVMHVLTRQEIVNGVDNKVDGIRVPPTHQQLLDRGYGDADVVSGSVVVVAYQVYRHSARGQTRAVWGTAFVPKGMTVSDRNIVEVESRDGIATIARVRYPDRQTGGCEFKLGERGVLSILDAINPIGGPRTANFDCPGLEQDGWVKAPSGYTGGYVWRKFPMPLPAP